MLIQRIVFGIVAIAAGVVMLKYNFQMVGLTGRQDWIEAKLGSGSTYTVYKLVALLLILGGALYMTGLGHYVLDPLLAPLRGFFPKNGG